MSTDPLQEKYPNISSYAYAFLNPIRYIDPTGMEGDPVTEAKSLIKGGKPVDMNNAPPSSQLTAKGFYRNGPWFWRQMLDKHPEMFSEDNITYIKNGKSPYVDDQWISFNGAHAKYKGGKLIHHHLDQGRFAIGLPEAAHKLFDIELHPRQGGFFTNVRNKFKVIGGKTVNGLASLTVVLDLFKIAKGDPSAMSLQFDPNAPLNTAQGFSDPIMYFISGNNFYEITNRNSDNSVLNVNWYSDYEKKDGVYRGKGLLESGTMQKQKNGSYLYTKFNGI